MKVPEKIDINNLNLLCDNEIVLGETINGIIDYLKKSEEQFDSLYSTVWTLCKHHNVEHRDKIKPHDNHEEHLKIGQSSIKERLAQKDLIINELSKEVGTRGVIIKEKDEEIKYFKRILCGNW